MKSDHEYLAEIVKKYKGENLPAHLVKVLDMVGQIKRKTNQLAHKKEQAERNYEIALAAIKTEEEDHQNKCPHYSTTYHGDASGGTDSETICDHCNKRW